MMNPGPFSPDVLISDVRFRAERQFELGRGSDAVVYRGTWYGAPAAVKVLHDELLDPANSEEGRDALLTRFDRECQRLRGLRHPNIVQFFGIGCTSGRVPILVTELISSTLLTRYKALPPLTRLRQFSLLRDTLAGLSYIHSQDIVHRDLTPKNVLVTKEGRAKVADVGVARSLHGDRPGDRGMTQAPGTLLYMPPEALTPQPTYDQRLDVFSFGVLMMSLILRREPSSDLLFSRREEVGPDGSLRPISETVRRARELREIGVDHPLHDAIVRCLDNNPALRPSSLDLYEELERIYCREEETGESTEAVARQDQSENQDFSALKAECDLLSLEKADIACQRDNAIHHCNELFQQRQELLHQRDSAMRECDDAIRQLDNVTRERDDAFRQRDYATRERDDAMTERDDAVRQRDNATRERDDVTRERDDAVWQQDDILQLQEDLLREQGHLRDQLEQHSRELCQLRQQNRFISIPQRADKSLAAAIQFNASLHTYQQMIPSASANVLHRLLKFTALKPLSFADKWDIISPFNNCIGSDAATQQLFIHQGRLLAIVAADDTIVICQSHNIQDWHKVDVDWSALDEPTGSNYRLLKNTFCIHQDQLYHANICTYPNNNSTKVYLSRVSFLDEEHLHAKLELLSVQEIRYKAAVFTMFSIGDSIVFAGESNDSFTCTYPTIHQFNVKICQWVNNSKWPDLPEPVAESIPIVTRDKVHLIGGVTIEPGSPLVAVTKVFTIDLIDCEPVSDWYTDDIPDIPHARCGAAQLHSHIIVAGGRHPTDNESPESFHSECYALDPVSRSWLHLPSLPYACSYVQLAAYKEDLVAAGGGTPSNWMDKVCMWHVSPV